MEQTPYLKTEIPDIFAPLSDKLRAKMQYLSDVQQAIAEDNNRLVYQLLDAKKYATLVEDTEDVESNRSESLLVDDLQNELSHHLSTHLIEYLEEHFPFFYYEEDELGVYQVYFGNWWDRRQFGILDPLTVSFIFHDEEYNMLAQAVELAASNRRYHTDVIEDATHTNEELQKLVDGQAVRNNERVQLNLEMQQLEDKRGIFQSAETKDRRTQVETRLAQLDAIDEKAARVPDLIAENNTLILYYSKEDTILIYEQRAIDEQFENFANFETAVNNLYKDYVSQLPSKLLTDEGGMLHD
ncbi:MAG: hypothetical protein LBT80_01550 [Lactobacillaceae bacterium]|jgi:hypothetical protein|nr:hypothetical protein [Lactobacillaceae bacterium]